MIPRIAAIGVVAILLFDLAASLAARSLGFDYARASFGSYLIYLSVGFFAARAAPASPIAAAALCAAITGLAEATLGWWIASMVGPGRFDQIGSAAQAIVIVFMVVLFSTFVGVIGGLIGRFFKPRVVT